MIWPTPSISFFAGFRSKIDKNKEMIFEKFQSRARPGTWWNRQLKFRCKSIIKECKNKVKTWNFKTFFIYTLRCWIFLLIVKNKKFAVTWSKSLTNEIFVKPSIFVLNTNNPRTQCINEQNFEILCLNFIFALFNNAFASKLQLSISPCSRSCPTLKLSKNHFLIFTDF
jgi:hypothetical protein